MKKYRFSNFLRTKFPLTREETKELTDWIYTLRPRENLKSSSNLVDNIKEFLYESNLKDRYERRFGREQLFKRIRFDTHFHLESMGYLSQYKEEFTHP